jgi:hypothetical protein
MDQVALISMSVSPIHISIIVAVALQTVLTQWGLSTVSVEMGTKDQELAAQILMNVL